MRELKPGDKVKTRYGLGIIIEHLPKEHQKDEERYMIKIDNPGRNLQARTHYPMGKPVHYEAGILFYFENGLEIFG